MRRTAAAAICLIVLALIGTSSAQATPPKQLTFTATDTFTDTTSCAFPVTTILTFRLDVTVFFDAQGVRTSENDHVDADGTDTAKGVSLTENDHYTDFFDWTTGADREAGTPIHIRLANGGVVIRDAGNVLFNPDGSIGFIKGPHPQLVGDTAGFCAAFG